MVQPEVRRRPSAVISCSLCRRRKIRCNRERPCSNCLRSKSEPCIYENPNVPILPRSPPPLPPSDVGNPNQSRLSESSFFDRASSTSGPTLVNTSIATSPTSSSSLPSTEDVDSLRLKLRVKQLEYQLSKANFIPNSTRASSPNFTITETTNSRLGGPFHVHCESTLSGQPHFIARSLTHKTRLLGQSHWEVNGILLIRDVLEAIEVTLRDETSRAWSGIENCKKLSRDIKARRAPPWPITLTTDLPSKEITDKLVECYLRTTESIYRILHLPTFQREYEALWVSETPPDIAFLIRLKLVLAIGAVTYDEQFSLRVSALRWVYEAQVWASDPFKLRLDIPSLQNDILLLMAQERLGIGGHLFWISMGALVRKASYIGLHRDPDQLLHSRTTFAVEMRRRLWNTILEINLQASLTSGGAPLISLDDFDTSPPGNFNDDQIMADHAVPERTDTFTQMSIPLALRTTFPYRLAVVKFLNDLTSVGSYEETLRLDAELRTAYKSLRQSLRGISNSHPSHPSPSTFEISAVDFLMHRYISSLHIPYFGPALTLTAYAFSRRVVIESSLKIWRAAYPLSTTSATNQSSEDVIPAICHDLSRLVTCSSGFYPSVAIHAAFLIYLEIRTQLQEDDGLGPAPLRPDLVSVLDDAKKWSLRVIESGETNIKGYLLLNLITAQIEGLKRGLAKGEIDKLLIGTLEEVAETCLPKLQKMMASTPAQNSNVGTADEQLSMSLNPDKLDDWNFMRTDSLFNLGTAEPMTWMLDDDDDFNQKLTSLW